MCNVVLPRVRDFRGLPPNAFDGRGNYTLGLRDQLVFPEIDYTTRGQDQGHEHHLTTTAKNDEEGRELLKLLGVPLRASRRSEGEENLWRETAKIRQDASKKPKFKMPACATAAGCAAAPRGLHPQISNVPHLFPRHRAARARFPAW